MDNKRYKATDVEQDGEFTGQPMGRVWIQDIGVDYVSWTGEGVGCVDKARRLAAEFNALSEPLQAHVIELWCADETELEDAIEAAKQ